MDGSDPMVATAWLAEHLGDERLRVLDATSPPPGDGRDARAEFAAGHIPGAAFFDINAVADTTSPLPHMLAAPDAFAEAVGAMGVGTGDRVVVYDALGLFSAARVWWNFRVMGHDAVWVLDGGLPKWRAEGRPLEAGEPSPSPALFEPRFRPELVRDLGQVREGLDGRVQILDARPAARFRGEAPEPRPGLRSGHMPGALSTPASALLNGDGTLPPAEALRARLLDAGADLDRPTITSCGSGVTAAIVALALARLGRMDVAVYDGSWTEWGGLPDTPVVTG